MSEKIIVLVIISVALLCQISATSMQKWGHSRSSNENEVNSKVTVNSGLWSICRYSGEKLDKCFNIDSSIIQNYYTEFAYILRVLTILSSVFLLLAIITVQQNYRKLSISLLGLSALLSILSLVFYQKKLNRTFLIGKNAYSPDPYFSFYLTMISAVISLGTLSYICFANVQSK